MRILVVGDAAVRDAAESVFGGRTDITLQTVAGAADVASRLDDGEPTLVFLHGGTESLRHLPGLIAKGALVVVIASSESVALRRSALGAEARDVLFAPVDGLALQACAEAVLGVPGRRHPRFDTAAPVTLVPVKVDVEGSAIDGTLRNLSAGGFRADLPRALVRGGLVAVRVNARPPALPARVLACEPSDTPGASRVHARFVGLTREERAALDTLIDRLRREPT